MSIAWWHSFRHPQVQAAACRDRVDQGLQLPGRGAPWTMPATQRCSAIQGRKPGAYRAQRLRPRRRWRGNGGARPPSPRLGLGRGAARCQRIPLEIYFS